VSQPDPNTAAERGGLADSEDLFNFDEIVAASTKSPQGAPVDVDALLKAFEDKPAAGSAAAASATAVAAHAVQAATAALSAAAAPSSAPALTTAAATPSLGVPQSYTLAAPPLSRKVWVFAGAALAALLSLNATLVWVSVHNASQAQERIATLSASMLELARQSRHDPLAQPLVTPAAATTSHAAKDEHTAAPATATETEAEAAAQRRQRPIADWDPDPRREQDFDRIDSLLADGLHSEARRQIYMLLARCDGLVGSAKGDVETRASFLLAHALRLEAGSATSAAANDADTSVKAPAADSAATESTAPGPAHGGRNP
jgi:hypothetical protein